MGLRARAKHLGVQVPPPLHLPARAAGEVGTRLAKKGLSPLHSGHCRERHGPQHRQAQTCSLASRRYIAGKQSKSRPVRALLIFIHHKFKKVHLK